MSDTFSKKKRSEIMRLVKSNKNKSTELKLIKFFRENSIKGWRRNFALTGKPDFVFPMRRIVIFADGCFWHGHNCRNTKPKDNKGYWQRKIGRNKERDKYITRTLSKKGWIVIRIWECQIKKDTSLRRILTPGQCP